MDTVLQFISGIPIFYIYLVLAFTIFMENIMPLVPGDTFLVFSAYFAGRGVLNPLFTYILTVVSSLSGFLLIYLIGFHWGRDYFERKNYSFFSQKRIQKADHYFNKYGDWVLIINRFLPGIRFLVAIIAGFTRIQLLKSFFYTAISVIVWNGIIFQLGRLLGENWHKVVALISQYNRVVTLIIVSLLAIFIIYRIRRKTVKLGEIK
ncbi:MAG: hypothetical protein DRP89_06710 [Candidatus Neomarinimicrobiota bacterium]|nr:MAG: hypothetical protein DRP89_06710 [Candidatus Neomarinimicrobiota bacterium]